MRKIAHVDMDAFYASVEQRDDPELRGKPVVVAWRGNRSVVCAASYEARRFGIRSAMPASRAERLCPDAIFVPPDFLRYRAISRQVREIFARHTDLIEPLSLDEAYLDVTENKTGLPTATRVAQAIRKQIREELNLTASAGVAPNKFLAKIASDWRKPDGLFVIQPADIASFLPSLPVGRIPGVGRVTENVLGQLRIRTVGDLQKMELSALEERFGRHGLRLHELARGLDESPVRPNRVAQSVSAEDTFESDVLLEETEPMIRRLAERTWSASRKESRIGRTVVLKLKTSDFSILTRSLTPSVPPSSCEELTEIALSLRERVNLEPERRFRLVGVGLSNFHNMVRRTVARINPLLALNEAHSMQDVISTTEAPRRIMTELVGAFAVTALLLALTGIYAVMSFSVTLRTQEIAIRMALGAHRSGITRLVLQSGAKLGLLGSAVGILGSLAASHLVRSYLFDVSPTDPWIYAGSILLMMAIAHIATLVPALRAASANPIAALRSGN
jgi:DNA polymerase-4